MEKNKWYNIIDNGVPPYDTRCIVRGKNDYGNFIYAIAYNECYRPYMNMTQVVELEQEEMNKLSIYLKVPFKIEEWMLVD